MSHKIAVPFRMVNKRTFFRGGRNSRKAISFLPAARHSGSPELIVLRRGCLQENRSSDGGLSWSEPSPLHRQGGKQLLCMLFFIISVPNFENTQLVSFIHRSRIRFSIRLSKLISRFTAGRDKESSSSLQKCLEKKFTLSISKKL